DSWQYAPSIRGVDVSDCPPLAFSYALPVMELSENFTVRANLGTYVPVAGVPQRLSLLDNVAVDRYGDLHVTQPLKPGQTYTAVCEWPVYSVAEMRKAKSIADAQPDYVERYLQLPSDQAPDVSALSEQIASKGANRFVQAEN